MLLILKSLNIFLNLKKELLFLNKIETRTRKLISKRSFYIALEIIHNSRSI